MLRANRGLVNHLAQWFSNMAARENPWETFLNDHCLTASLKDFDLTVWGTAWAWTSHVHGMLLFSCLYLFLPKLCRRLCY